MLMENKFGKISRITACAALKNGKTILEDLSFTAPYKIMAPFEKENGGIQIMRLSPWMARGFMRTIQARQR